MSSLRGFAVKEPLQKPPHPERTVPARYGNIEPMKQTPLDISLRKTRKREFLEQREQVVPWAALVELIVPYYPKGTHGRPPFSLETMLRIHFMQQWFTLSDPGMEEAFFDVPLYREFARLEEYGRLPDESTLLRFRHRLEKHQLAEQILSTINELLIQRGLLLKAGTVVDATLIPAPTSTKNADKARDPEMHSTQKGKQWDFYWEFTILLRFSNITYYHCSRPKEHLALNFKNDVHRICGSWKVYIL